MTTYESLLIDAEKENVSVIENFDLTETRLKGLYCDRVIALGNQIVTETEKACVLAEELGHHYTTVGNILNQELDANRKQELHARMWAYNHLVGLCGIVKSYKAGYNTVHDMAEYMNVTEEFLSDALERYRQKYGVSVHFDNYSIYFEPNLQVLEVI